MIKTFFRNLFGEVSTGRLNRMQFIGYTFLVMALMMLLVFGAILAVGTAERAADNVQEFQAMMADKFGMPLVIGTMVVGSIFTFASLNLTAKRVRDMGLPAWTTVLVLVLIGVIIGSFFPGEMITIDGVQRMQPSLISSTFQAVIFLALSLIPGNTFGHRN